MLDISRKDVTSEYLMEFEVPERFIKLPIANYLGLLDVEPNGPQTAIINAINNPKYRFISAAVSRRVGKTYIANIIGQVVSLVPGSNILIMSPNYSLSQISFDLQRQLIKHFDLEVRRDNAKDKIIELSNGSTIRMGSVSQVDSCVGRSYDLIIFDEAALQDAEHAFNVALRPTLDKSNSKALFISTPRGRNNWFARFFNRGYDPTFPEWVSVHADYKCNPRVSDEDIEEARRTMTENEFAQEYLASFNSYEGQIWKFNREECVQNLEDFDFTDRDIDLIGGLDVGFRDPTAFIVLAYDWKADKYYALAEYYNAEKTTSVHAMNIKKLMDHYQLDTIYIDSASQQTRYDFAMDYNISCTNAKKSVKDGIGHVGSIIEQDKLIVDQECRKLLESLDQYQWDPNPNLINEKPLHDSFCHMADSLRYAIYSHTTSVGVY